MAKTIQTAKGTQLPLTNLKGKDYLMVAYRLQWLTEEVPNYTIHTHFLHVDDDQTICKAMVTIYDTNGKIVKAAEATKRETKKDFPDHTEKAETSAIGRALAMLGFGTQHALADLDEGDRIVDSPVVDTRSETRGAVASKPVSTSAVKEASGDLEKEKTAETKKPSGGFGVKKTEAAATTKSDDGWS